MKMAINVMVRHIVTYLYNINLLKFVSENDECEEETDLCEQICVNTAGSYICQCNLGYRLNSDMLTCRGKKMTVL